MSEISSYSSALSNLVLFTFKEQLELFIVELSAQMEKDLRIKRQDVINVFNKVMPECATTLEEVLEREKAAKVALERKAALAQKRKDAPKCAYPNGKSSKNPDGVCDGYCANEEPFEDGNVYCNRHRKMLESRHVCSFIKKTKSGDEVECGSRIPKDAKEFESEYECDENGTWLCKTHTKTVTKRIEKEAKPFCSHENTKGAQCSRRVEEDGDLCPYHSKPKEKKEKESATKKTDKKADSKSEKGKKSSEKEEKKSTKIEKEEKKSSRSVKVDRSTKSEKAEKEDKKSVKPTKSEKEDKKSVKPTKDEKAEENDAEEDTDEPKPETKSKKDKKITVEDVDHSEAASPSDKVTIRCTIIGGTMPVYIVNNKNLILANKKEKDAYSSPKTRTDAICIGTWSNKHQHIIPITEDVAKFAKGLGFGTATVDKNMNAPLTPNMMFKMVGYPVPDEEEDEEADDDEAEDEEETE